MKVEFEKKMRIVGDLLSYCHLKGAVEFHVDMTDQKDAWLFIIKAYPLDISEEEFEELRKNLYAPRQMEIEHDFWGLMGESESFSELMLVGMMSDEAGIEYHGDELTIMIKRYD